MFKSLRCRATSRPFCSNVATVAAVTACAARRLASRSGRCACTSCDLRLGGFDIGGCLIPRGAIIVVHNLDNELPGTNLVKILHRDGADIA